MIKMVLDNEARIIVEKNIDSIIKNPYAILSGLISILRDIGIQATLETVLSYITGDLVGLIYGYYASKYKRLLTKEEHNELTELLKRRAFELRIIFIKALSKEQM